MRRAILIKSCQRFRARQEAIRATWAKELCDWADRNILFIEGGHRKFDVRDGVIRVTCGDAYSDNSLKLREALIFLKPESYPDDDDFHLFVCDDDTFIHPRRWLVHEPEGEFECRLFMPMTDRDVKLNSGRPWACGGAGWYMSRRVCELYVQHVAERCSWDDVLATKVAQDNGIIIDHRPQFYSQNGERVSADNQLITCHHVQPQEMVELYEATRGL